MKRAFILSLAVLSAAVMSLPAQIRSGGLGFGGFGGGRAAPGNIGPPPASANHAGFGSVVFPGGSTSFGSSLNTVYSNMQFPNYSQTFAGRLGAVVAGQPVPLGSGYRRGGSGFVGGVYPVPVFVGGGYNYGYQDTPNVTVVNVQPATPAVIVNPNYQADAPARPVMRVYGNTSVNTGVNTIAVPAPSYPEGNPIQPGAIVIAGGNANAEVGDTSATATTDEPAVYLIALKDGTIYASYAFWAERDMLHYITPGHAHNQVSMDRVDLPLSRRLNRERKLEFNFR